MAPVSTSRSASAASAASRGGPVLAGDVESFATYLASCDRILALLGAGLSAGSGLPTFRGAGGLWRRHDAMSLATPEAFSANPALVWQFYNYRRHMALTARPNRAHRALAALAKSNPNFVTLTQNVDGLSQRAGHPSSTLHLLHGSLFDVKCTSFYCSYTEHDNFTDPIVPALAIPTAPSSSHANAGASQEVDLSDHDIPMADVPTELLPRCPECHTGLLRPGVVWFGEALPENTIDAIDAWIRAAPRIDLILVIGTSSRVYPAASYIDEARAKGARVAVVNMDPNDLPKTNGGLKRTDWFFQGDAAVLLPEMLRGVVGEIA